MRIAPDPRLVEEAVELISSSKRPVIVAGSGVYFSHGEDRLNEFAEKYKIPVVVPIWDQGVIPEGAEHFVGFIGAAYGGPRLLPDADLLLLAGARIDYRTGFGQPPGLSENVKIIRIDVEPQELVQGREADVPILADMDSAMTALLASAETNAISPHGQWLGEARSRWEQFRSPWTQEAPPSEPPLVGRHVVEAIRPLLKDSDLLFLMDGGNIGQWVHMALGDQYPENWMTCGPSGVVGWGVSGGIAAKLAHPDKRVLLLSGDGAIGFNLMEVETAVRHGTPLVIIVADDRQWGSVVTGQERSYGSEGITASLLGPVAYDQVAEGLGGRGVRATSSKELEAAIQEGFVSGQPTVIHVPIEGSAPKGGAAV